MKNAHPFSIVSLQANMLYKDEEIKNLKAEVTMLKAESQEQDICMEDKSDEKLNEIVTLAAGKSAGHKRETPQSQLIQKKTQHHCALSNLTSGILCDFQCSTKEDLEKHIGEKHTIYPCADRNCTVECNTLDKLAMHVATLHKRPLSKNAVQIKCNQCETKFQTKDELMEHLKSHKSYKPCKRYVENKCGTENECRYKHVILPPGVQVCYKCGVTSSSKTDIMKHIKSSHGTKICHNFLLNKCDFDHCMFSHAIPSEIYVEITPEREMDTPTAPTEEDFFNLPTTGPVVRTEPRAQPLNPQVKGLSGEEAIRQVVVTQISMHMEKMLPEIMAKITEAITQMNLNHN